MDRNNAGFVSKGKDWVEEEEDREMPYLRGKAHLRWPGGEVGERWLVVEHLKAVEFPPLAGILVGADNLVHRPPIRRALHRHVEKARQPWVVNVVNRHELFDLVIPIPPRYREGEGASSRVRYPNPDRLGWSGSGCLLLQADRKNPTSLSV